MSGEKFFIPRHLDDPPRFLFWSIDDAMVMIFPLFVGIILGFVISGVICSVFLYRTWRGVKGSGGVGIVQCLIYWHYPKSILDLKMTPDSSIKSYIS